MTSIVKKEFRNLIYNLAPDDICSFYVRHNDCALILCHHPYNVSSAGLYLVTGGYLSDGRTIHPIQESDGVRITKMDDNTVKIEALKSVFVTVLGG